MPLPAAAVVEATGLIAVQALTGEQADLDLRLVQPTAMFRGVLRRELYPPEGH
jgi:hypothetical protein